MASNPYEARDKILELHPDVMTLDVNMPKMSGIEFLKKINATVSNACGRCEFSK